MLLLLIGLVSAVLPESKNMRKRIIGVPQELGRSCRLLGNSRLEHPGEQLQASTVVLGRRGANISSTTEVPPSEGNEAQWDGWQEVIVPDSTVEAGERCCGRSQWRKAGHRVTEPFLRNTTNASTFGHRVNEPETDSTVATANP